MKVARIGITINPSNNTHKKFLYNEVLNFARKEGLGGEFRTEGIKLPSVPEPLLKFFEESKIVFERILDKK